MRCRSYRKADLPLSRRIGRASTSRNALFVLFSLQVATACFLLLFLDDRGSSVCESSGVWAACDQTLHISLINHFIQYPFSFFDYPDPQQIATLPGFHLLMAWIARLLGMHALGPDSWLRIVPFVLGLGVLVVLWKLFHDLSGNPWYAALLCLPIAWSNYFYLSSIFVVTENAAYLGYAFLLMAYLRFPARGLATGLAAAAMVSARQIFLPVVAAQFFALSRPFDRARILALALGILPALTVVAAYSIAWGGLVPPEARDLHGARTLFEPGPVVQAISLLGLLAVPYGFLAYPHTRELWCRRRVAAVVFATGIAALMIWLLAPTTRDLDAGRAGAFLWLLARFSPAIHEHALFALPSLVLGFVAGGFIVQLARSREYRPIELIMWLLYVAALSMQLLSYQRYCEVPTLIMLSTTLARLTPPTRLGAAAFAAVFAAKFIITLLMPQGG